MVSADGYTMDPSRMESIKSIDLPQTAEELAQFLFCCRWMANATPNFNVLTEPLAEILERAYQKSGKRTNKSIPSIPVVDLSWGAQHTAAFTSLQASLQNAVKIAYPDPTKRYAYILTHRRNSGLVSLHKLPTQNGPRTLRSKNMNLWHS